MAHLPLTPPKYANPLRRKVFPWFYGLPYKGPFNITVCTKITDSKLEIDPKASTAFLRSPVYVYTHSVKVINQNN